MRKRVDAPVIFAQAFGERDQRQRQIKWMRKEWERARLDSDAREDNGGTDPLPAGELVIEEDDAELPPRPDDISISKVRGGRGSRRTIIVTSFRVTVSMTSVRLPNASSVSKMKSWPSAPVRE